MAYLHFIYFLMFIPEVYRCILYIHTAHGQTLSGPQIIFFFYGNLKEVSIHFHLILLSLYKHAYYILKAIKHFLNGSPKILNGDPRYLYKYTFF